MQQEIIGADRVDQLYAAAAADELHIQHLLSANCFGDHLTRSGLDVLLDVITQLLPFIGYPRTLNALRVINDAAPA